MNNQHILDCMNHVDADLIEAADRQPVKRLPRKAAVGWIAAAACLVLLAGSGLGAHVYAAEQREYKAAVTFFAKNELSTEGLTRGEIKAVYRDITAERFSFAKTAEVLQNSLLATVPGYEIPEKAPTPEEIESLWSYQRGYRNLLADDPGDYQIQLVEGTDPDTSLSFTQASVVSRFENGTCLWQTRLDTLAVQGHQPLSHGLLVWGSTPSGAAAVAKLDAAGKHLWTRVLSNDFQKESVGAAAENPDGSVAVFSQGDLQYLCVSQYGADGALLSFRKHPAGHSGIRNAARLGENYLVQLGDNKLVCITREGELTDSFRYTEADRDYHMVDLQEFDGHLYLSAYTTPKTEYHDELSSIVADHQNLMQMPEAKLTQLVRANYQAVLLICDPLSGTPRQFYAVPGNLGGDLKLDDKENLIWQTEDIQAVGFSPATNAFRFYGTSERFSYLFAPKGVLISKTETGEMVPFRRW